MSYSSTWAQQGVSPGLPVPSYMHKLEDSYFASACGTERRMRELRKDASFEAMEAHINKIIQQASTGNRWDTPNYILPIVFHIVSNNPSAITDAQMLAGLQDLNDAFAHTGVFATGPGANTHIQFCLAQKDPEGGNTTGITRTTSYLTDMDADMEEDKLKALVDWDPTRYINVWYISSITQEILPIFQCGSWTRMSEGGNATMPSDAGAPDDGIVITGFGILFPHEMGHYLGLYHTFQGMDCKNDDCSTDGDLVCDTPPQKDVFSSPSCSSPVNSCSTDTLSGFTTDVPDLISNFMSYGNAPCINEFTEGQASRMRATIATVRSSLLVGECTAPCAEASEASFTRSNPYPLPGSTVTFTNASTGATQFQWSVNNTVISNATNFSYTFPTSGKYAVNLKAYNTNATCYSDYSDNVIVSCGVMARFTPNKQTIASKDSIYLDSIAFTSRSVNATAYEWLLSNGSGMNDSLVGTSPDLTYTFGAPGQYTMVLVATNGSCTDTTEPFSIPVLDPTADGLVTMENVHCYHGDSIQFSLIVCNNGYAPIPAGTPVSFYNANPETGPATKLGSSFLLPNIVLGLCCNASYSVVLGGGQPHLNQLYAVFDDSSSATPITLPNTGFPELNYGNNIVEVNDFQFTLLIAPFDTTVIRKQSFTFRLSAPDQEAFTAVWSQGPGYVLSCTACDSPSIQVFDTSMVYVTASSAYGCSLTDSVAVLIFPPDLTVTVNSTDCYTNDSLLVRFTLCMNNGYDSVWAGIPVSFYGANPNTGAGSSLLPLFTTTVAMNGSCLPYTQVIKMPVSDSLYAVVNAGETITETNYANNGDVFALTPFQVSISPPDTSVPVGSLLPMAALVTGGTPSQEAWSPTENLSCPDCLETVLAPPFTQEYRVIVKNQYDCIDTAYALIKAYTGGEVNIPSAFTPNGDGQNDVFYVLGGKNVVSVRHLSVYSRYGSKMFDVANVLPDDPTYGWNGTINGKNAEPGTYVYMVEIGFADGRNQWFKGTLELLR